mmetsp:Transcript_5128/g.15355  ORF Transcript_5128/g.15355 Transcript_5128/m.15355 type:complete len:107 (+) Transcript_5128:149-469(+)
MFAKPLQVWRLHPHLQPKHRLRSLFPGLGIASAAFGAYVIYDLASSAMGGGSDHGHGHGHGHGHEHGPGEILENGQGSEHFENVGAHGEVLEKGREPMIDQSNPRE